jgi:Electron transfer DM13
VNSVNQPNPQTIGRRARTIGRRATTRRALRLAAAVIVVAIGWYLFRPELLFISHRISETFPTTATKPTITSNSAPLLLSQGHFHGVAHTTQGLAGIYQLPDGKRALRLTEFETSNGPDVQVYLVAATDATDNETVTKAGFIHLGALKGNVGDQNYEVPAEVELTKYQAVIIWCRRFGVNFGTAPLTQPHS